MMLGKLVRLVDVPIESHIYVHVRLVSSGIDHLI